jgi:hypothetical protein
MDATASGSRLVCAADSIVLTASKTIIANSSGTPIAIFNDSGINADKITANTLNVARLPGLTSLATYKVFDGTLILQHDSLSSPANPSDDVYHKVTSGQAAYYSTSSGDYIVLAGGAYYEVESTFYFNVITSASSNTPAGLEYYSGGVWAVDGGSITRIQTDHTNSEACLTAKGVYDSTVTRVRPRLWNTTGNDMYIREVVTRIVTHSK